MPRVKKPDRGNRAESVDEIWKRLQLGAASADFDGEVGTVDSYLAVGRISPAIGASRLVAHFATCAALAARWDRAPRADDLMKRAFALFYWHAELDLAERWADNWTDQAHDDALYDLLGWQGLACACGENWFADWVAPHLHNMFASGGVAKSSLEFAVDPGAHAFHAALQLILVSGQWPATIDPAHFQAFAPLLVTAHDPSAFAQALVDYCDYRVAQCFGYDGIDAEKKRKPSQDKSIMDRGGWDQAIPAELFTLKRAYEKATGKSLSLSADHPLLHSPLTDSPFPALAPLWEDEVTQKLARFYQKAFGTRRPLRQPTAVRYL